MSANIPSTMPMSDLLKSTGYDCPEELQGKTFEEATSGGGDTRVQTNTAVTITENGSHVVEPDEGYDATKKVTVNVNVPSDAKPEQTKSVTITENGTTAVTPDEGKTLSGVNVTVNVPGASLPTGGGTAYSLAWEQGASAGSSANGTLLIVFGDLYQGTGTYLLLSQTSGGAPTWWEEAVWGDVADLNFVENYPNSNVTIDNHVYYVHDVGSIGDPN